MRPIKKKLVNHIAKEEHLHLKLYVINYILNDLTSIANNSIIHFIDSNIQTVYSIYR